MDCTWSCGAEASASRASIFPTSRFSSANLVPRDRWNTRPCMHAVYRGEEIIGRSCWRSVCFIAAIGLRSREVVRSIKDEVSAREHVCVGVAAPRQG